MQAGLPLSLKSHDVTIMLPIMCPCMWKLRWGGNLVLLSSVVILCTQAWCWRRKGTESHEKQPSHVASLICPQIYEGIKKSGYFTPEESFKLNNQHWLSMSNQISLMKTKQISCIFFQLNDGSSKSPFVAAWIHTSCERNAPHCLLPLRWLKRMKTFLPNRDGLISRLPYTTGNNFNLLEKGCFLSPYSLLLHKLPRSWLKNVPLQPISF